MPNKENPLADQHFDAVVIGAGLSGLAAGIRLAHFGKRVAVLERHYALGGLNSFYSMGKRKFDVGLHAVTNYANNGAKGSQINRLFRQLRVDRDSFALSPQNVSRIAFPGTDIRFGNDFALMESEVERNFPDQIDGFRRLTQRVHDFDVTDINQPFISTRAVIEECISEPLLQEMMLCPVMYYGGSRERDLDFFQFVLMFRSIFLEGLARPFEGIRQIIRALRARLKEAGGLLKVKNGVKTLRTRGEHVHEIELDDGSILTADSIVSSAGWVETMQMCEDQTETVQSEEVGQISFFETISCLDLQPKELGWDETTVFFNDSEQFEYARPGDLVDYRSGGLSIPNNFNYPEGETLEEGVIRVTVLANFEKWTQLAEDAYGEAKEKIYEELLPKVISSILPNDQWETFKKHTTFKDTFTPRTVRRFTYHSDGAIYGSKNKVKSGLTHLKNLFICGTDQGYHGIIGAMLSGIEIANRYVLAPNSNQS